MIIDPTDFHRYAFSDCLDNLVRGKLGEYIVALALGIDNVPPLTSWESYDLEYRGYGIEVKTSAYVQTWKQKSETKPTFGIPLKRGWNVETASWDNEVKRHALVYVFCLYTEKDLEKARLNILNTDHWQFYVVRTSDLPDQKSMGLNTLKSLTQPISFSHLRTTIDQHILN